MSIQNMCMNKGTKSPVSTNKHTVSRLRLGTWNIQGLKGSTSDELFNKFLHKNDIIILTETWAEEGLAISEKEFYNFHSIRKRHARAKRSSGGISILIRRALRTTVGNKIAIKIIKESSNIVWIQICKEAFGIPVDIFIGAVYLPPQNSTINQKSDSDPFQAIESDVIQFKNKGEVILLGDFNARTACLKDFTNEDINNFVHGCVDSDNLSVIEMMGREGRNNLDSTINTYGRHLIDLCKGADLRILNGRTVGDLKGAYTSFQYNGSSVVDYCIASEQLLPVIQSLTVSSPNHISDHAFIETSLSVNKFQSCDPISDNSTNIAQQFKWNLGSKDDYQKIMESSAFQKRIQSFLSADNETDINSCTSDLRDIMIDAAKLSLKRKVRRRTGQRKDKLGFDNQCRTLKNETLSLGKLV